MARTTLGHKALSVLVATTMVVSLNAPISAWADNSTGNAAATTEEPQAENPSGGGSEGVASEEAGEVATQATDGEANNGQSGEAATYVAKIGDVEYASLAEAITAASDGATITLGAGKFTTYGNASPKKSLTFVGAGDATVWTIGNLSNTPGGEGNGDYSFDGCDTITFKDMTLKSDGADYRGFIRINNTVVENCTLVGKTAYWGYNTAKFIDSTFNAPEGDYALWDYSTKSMSFDGCTFNISGKGVNVYVEGGNADSSARSVEVKDCTVKSTKANKAFLNIKNKTQEYNVTISGNNTVEGLSEDTTTGSNLFQVETAEVTETSGKPVSIQQKFEDGTLTTVYEVKKTTTMTLDDFITALVASDYSYDGQGVTVKWSPETGCYDTREGHTCMVDNVKATGNTPKRVNSELAQFQMFEGQSNNVTVKNVNFVYVPADFTVCENSGWKGSFTAEQAPAGQLYFMTTGDVNFEGCTFDKTVLTSFNTVGATTVKNCQFSNVYNNYAIKDIRGANVSVTGTTITNCGGGIMVSSTGTVDNVTITGNTFKNVDIAGTALENKVGTRALIQIASSGNYGNAAFALTDNTANNCGPVIRQLNESVQSETSSSLKYLAEGENSASGLATEDSKNQPAETTYVAEVNGMQYETLQEAVDAAVDGDTVILLGDITIDAVGEGSGLCPQYTISGKKITLDLQGHKIGYSQQSCAADHKWTAAIMTLANKADVVITGDGAMDAELGYNNSYGINVIDGSKLTIENGTFTGATTAVQVQSGNLTINGGTFDLAATIKSAAPQFAKYVINCLDASFKDGSAAIELNGGSYCYDYSKNPEGEGTSYLPAGKGVDRTDGGFAVVNGVAQLVDADGDSIKAYATLADAIAAATDGQTIKLLADAVEDVTVNKSITFDLDGKTLTNTNAGKATISVTNGATAIVKNGSVMGGKSYYNIEVVKGSNANLTLEDVTATAGNTGSSMIDNWGMLTIESGTYTGGLDTVKNEPSAKLDINGGSFTLEKGSSKGFTGVVFNYGELTITGGTFIQADKNARYGQAQVIHTDKSGSVAPVTTISGGSFKNLCTNRVAWTVRVTNAAAGSTAVSGGTFNKSISEGYCADGFIPTKNADGTYGVKKGSYVAQIGSTKYETLADAIAAAASGKTITLLSDIDLDQQIAISEAITIDGQGTYTIKATKKLEGTNGKAGMFYRTTSAQGTLTFLDVTLDGNGVSKIFLNEGGAGETVFDGVTATNGGGTAYGSGIHISGGGSHATIVNSTLTGSTGTLELSEANYYAANDLWVGGNVYVTVENSTIGYAFVNSAPSATPTNGVVHGQLTITGENTKIAYLSGEEKSSAVDKFGNNGSLVKIDNGSIDTVFDKGSYAISGGVFKTQLKKEWCAAGYVPSDNGDGTYGVAEGKYTVQVTSRTTESASPVANVTGGGSDITYAHGTTVTASAVSGYEFVGWYLNSYSDSATPLSTEMTCTVNPTSDCIVIAVYKPVEGGAFSLKVAASKFKINDGATQRSYLLEKVGVGEQVTVEFAGSENFLYWVNESDKVVSTEKAYSFLMGSETSLKAVYAEKETGQAMVVFSSHVNQVVSSKSYSSTEDIQFPEPPIRMGATFLRWSMTQDQIREAMSTTETGIIVVKPVYESDGDTYTVTVNYPDGTATATDATAVGEMTELTAKDIDGKTFKCWKNGEDVWGYTQSLKVAPRGDLALTAEYVDAGTQVDRTPVISLTEISASQQGQKYAVSFTATRSVPEGYTVVEQGILASTDSRYGESDALDAMKLDSDGARPAGTQILKVANTDLTGVTVLNGTTKYADRVIYGRAYMILHDDVANKVKHVYSNAILFGSYNSLTNGGN